MGHGQSDGSEGRICEGKIRDTSSEVRLDLKCPLRTTLALTVKLCDPCKVLFEEVKKLTGVPTTLQMLYHGIHFLRPEVPLEQYSLRDGDRISLSVKGLGGGGSDEGKQIVGHAF